jgi:hypothetical protein
MNTGEHLIIVGFIMIGVICFSAGWGIGRAVILSEAAKNAIERGHAEWALKNGGPEVEFRWKEPGKCGLKVEEKP